jgi:isoquinoline 1-oxidoreductase alpha subunit
MIVEIPRLFARPSRGDALNVMYKWMLTSKRQIFILHPEEKSVDGSISLLCRDRDMLTLSINGQSRQVDAPEDMPLLWVLRDHLNLVGTKYGCGIAQCGVCTVHVGGKPVRSCQLAVGDVGTRAVVTIEGIGNTPNGAKVQQAWIEGAVPQCGYCQAGQIMSATALLDSNPHPDDSDIDAAMAGNLCRCGTYIRVRRAIKDAAVKSA